MENGKLLKKKRRQVNEAEIAETISMQTGIPVKRLGSDDIKMIKKWHRLKEYIIGQDRCY